MEICQALQFETFECNSNQKKPAAAPIRTKSIPASLRQRPAVPRAPGQPTPSAHYGVQALRPLAPHRDRLSRKTQLASALPLDLSPCTLGTTQGSQEFRHSARDHRRRTGALRRRVCACAAVRQPTAQQTQYYDRPRCGHLACIFHGRAASAVGGRAGRAPADAPAREHADAQHAAQATRPARR